MPSKRTDAAASCFRRGFNCAQAVLSAFGPSLGMDRRSSLRVAGAFGAGMGRLAETCGAVTGALMVIGLRGAMISPGDTYSKEECYRLAREFVHRFKTRNGHIRCRTLLGCHIGTQKGMREAQKRHLFARRCPKYLRDSGEILEELLRPVNHPTDRPQRLRAGRRRRRKPSPGGRR